MHPNDRYMIWFVLVTAGYLVRQCCQAAEHAPAASARKLSGGVAAMHFNHLFPGPASDEGFSGAGESVKFSATKQHVLHAEAAWRKPAGSGTLAGNWRVRKPLAKPTTASRSRINNRSMTRFSEVEIPAGLQHREADGALEQPPTLPTATNVTGLAELFRSAEQSRGVENFFWKYFVDSDVSASTDDDDDDDGDGAEKGTGGLITLQGRKKKFHLKKKYKKFLIPLLLAYKIKFLALVPAIIGGLILLVKSAGLAGFFFALFTAVVSLKKY
uniref:Transmembrane protein n=1 Tax=Anopheles atroparvus TaxID=41427 RepID=A0A182IM03_ANOAO